MKDLEIGTVFVHPTMGTLKVARAAMPNDCNGCVFHSNMNPYCRNDIEKVHSGECSFERRYDRNDVIFIKVKGENND